MGKVTGRKMALVALTAIDEKEMYSHKVIKKLLDDYDYLEAREKAFFKRLTEGTLERRMEMDYWIEWYSKVPVHKMRPLIRNLLRMSVYQLLYMDSVPDSAVCDEAVKLARAYSYDHLRGFVNGILRNLSRGKDSLAYPSRETRRLKYLSVKYSMPVWIIKKWERELGEKREDKNWIEELLQASLEKKPVTIRLKRNLSGKEQASLREELEREGICVRTEEKIPYVWYLEKTQRIDRLESFCRGLFTVQDLSSVLAVEAAGIREGDFVMDVCAAPGGKALYGAELAGAAGRVLARDVSQEKCSLIREGAERMKAQNVTVEEWDACNFDPTKKEKADVVLADVPCSGLGVTGRKPDIKYRVSREDIKTLVALQRKILETVSGYVKPGGRLLYSTCTISRSENQGNARWFESHFPFRLEESRQFLPSEDGTDGFFYAAFVRE